jgi:hypothetical protein
MVSAAHPPLSVSIRALRGKNSVPFVASVAASLRQAFAVKTSLLPLRPPVKSPADPVAAALEPSGRDCRGKTPGEMPSPAPGNRGPGTGGASVCLGVLCVLWAAEITGIWLPAGRSGSPGRGLLLGHFVKLGLPTVRALSFLPLVTA